MNTKRRKLCQQLDKDNKYFLSMNNDCIFKIFEWLDLDDICSVSETCKQLKLLSSDYFQRKYRQKLLHAMRIVAVNGKIELQPNERCVRSFSRCFDAVIVNVDLRGTRNIDVSKLDLPLLIRENCNENLSSLQFQSMFLYASVGDCIKSHLEHVETIAFLACDLEGSYQQILRHCKNLKYLSVGESFGNKIDQLLLETYPKLEQFNCRYYGRLLMTNNLKTFLKHHPKLKRLTWCFHARIREATICDKTLECIDMLVENGANLEELFLSFDGTYNLASICDKLKLLCDRQQFTRLELDFRYTTLGYKVSQMMIEHGHQLTTLKSLLGLHLCDFSDYGGNILPTLSTMENLRILQLDTVTSLKRLDQLSLSGLSNLEELHVSTLVNVQLAQKFICEVRTLKIISILRCKLNISRLNLAVLNIERKRLPLGVCKVVIYVDGEAKRMTDKELDEELVKIEFVDFQINQVNLTNPFIQRSIIQRQTYLLS